MNGTPLTHPAISLLILQQLKDTLATDKVPTDFLLLSELQQHNQETSATTFVKKLYYLKRVFQIDYASVFKHTKLPNRDFWHKKGVGRDFSQKSD